MAGLWRGICLFSVFILGTTQGGCTVGAEPLRIAAPALPPMVVLEGTGHEQKILTETLGRCGFEPRFVLFPFGKHWQAYAAPDQDRGGVAGQAAGTAADDARFDAVSTVPPDLSLPGARSADYIWYQNGVTVLDTSGFRPVSLADLAGRRVIAFADARKILPGLEAVIPTFASYTEKADQMVHSSLLFAGRVDVVLSDGLMISEFNRRLRERVGGGEQLAFDPSRRVHFHALFPPSPYHMVFRNSTQQQVFDRCLSEMVLSGRHDALMREAVSPYRSTVGDQYLGF